MPLFRKFTLDPTDGTPPLTFRRITRNLYLYSDEDGYRWLQKDGMNKFRAMAGQLPPDQAREFIAKWDDFTR